MPTVYVYKRYYLQLSTRKIRISIYSFISVTSQRECITNILTITDKNNNIVPDVFYHLFSSYFIYMICSEISYSEITL